MRVFRWIVLLFLFAVLGMMALAGFIVQTFGWGGFLGVVAAAAVFAYVFAQMLPRILFAAMTAPLQRIGKVLAGAAVRVNSFVAAEPPSRLGSSDDDEADEQRLLGKAPPIEWYALDVTISPHGSRNVESETLLDKKWQPDALVLVSAETKFGPRIFGSFASMFAGTMCLIAEKEVWDGLEFVPHDGGELWGIQRLRLHVGVPEGIKRLNFIYQMFVRFGDIPVPHDTSLRDR